MIARAGAALLAVLVAPALADANWSPPERVRSGEPPSRYEVFGGGRDTPLKVRLKGGTVTLPGSEGGGVAAVAEGPRGLIAVAWARTACDVTDEPGDKGGCTGTVLATRWRRGRRVPRPVVLSRADGSFPSDPALAIAADGTVAVAWDVEDDDYAGVPIRVDAAVARGTRPFAVRELMAGDAVHAGVQRVRGAAQVAVVSESSGATLVGLADARGGRLGRPRIDGRIPGGHSFDAKLLRTGRGDRLLVWSDDEDDGRVLVRHGAPGRRLRRAKGFPGYPEFSAALSERGDFGLLIERDAGRNLVRQRVVRGRTGRRRTLGQALAPASYTKYGIAGGNLAIDRAGRTYVVWDRGLPRSGGRPAGSVVMAATAARGQRFGRGEQISTMRKPGFCITSWLEALPRGGALARWRCDPSGRARAFRQHAVFRPGG